MKYSILILSILLFLGCEKDKDPVVPDMDTFVRGADLSFLPEIEAYSIRFYNSAGEAHDVLTILKNAGCNTVRLRLWHTPQNGHSGFEEVLSFTQRIKDAGMNVYITIHYSDTWADPGQQTLPVAWQNLDLNGLKDSVYAYTLKMTAALQPHYLSIGNEINAGFLWDFGKINTGTGFVDLLKEGIRAVRDVSSTTKIIIHFAGITGSDWFFDQMTTNNVDFDIIGISYYPCWHGKDLAIVKNTLDALANDFDKDILIAETAYPFTLDWDDWTDNTIGQPDQLYPGFDATPQGQEDFMQALKDTILSVNKGIGFCYWGGEWIAFKGSQSTNGSPWENQALFDFNHKALPVLNVYFTED